MLPHVLSSRVADSVTPNLETEVLVTSLCEVLLRLRCYVPSMSVGMERRVGRVLVRKLVLRGYNVRVLVRNKAQVLGILPSSVGIIEGDVGSPETLRAAVEGTDKASQT